MSEAPLDYWAYFADETRRMQAPLYTQIVTGIAQDDELKALAATVRKGQPMANVLLAAVHFLLLRGAEHPLRRFYPNLNGGARLDNEDPFPLFKAFVNAHRAEVASLVATKVTNTNEVGRSAYLHVGFRALAAEAGTPLHLVEIGPSAGLNQFWDRYAVSFQRAGETCRIGPDDADLVLTTELRGEKVPPLTRTPAIASRIGLERNPVDLSDSDQRDWLRALVWPDQTARFAQLERALSMMAREKPNIRPGDALDLLPEVLRELPEDGAAVCVYHTFVVYQFSEEMRRGLDDMLIAMGLRRPLWRLGVEGTLSGDAPMLLYSYRDGVRERRELANCSPHGHWLEWR